MTGRSCFYSAVRLCKGKIMNKVDVIIPIYKPDKGFFSLMDMLLKQTVPVDRIILMNTEERYFNQLIYGTTFKEKYKNVVVYHHSKREFDHGNTRNRAVKRSEADVFIMMTQDAIPADEFLVEKLLEPLKKDKIAISYARQLPKQDASEIESFVRSFNYPDEDMVKSKEDLERLGVKTYFCSNVCAAYNRRIFVELGGFVRHTIFNEDMIFAAKAVTEGYSIAYAAGARVFHSHNYTNKEQFKRNFDLGVSQADHPEIFDGIPSESEGKKLVKLTREHFRKEKKQKELIKFYVNCAFRLMGYKLGKNYKRLPKALVKRFTMNRDYWRYYQMKREVSRIDATKGYGKNADKEGE